MAKLAVTIMERQMDCQGSLHTIEMQVQETKMYRLLPHYYIDCEMDELEDKDVIDSLSETFVHMFDNSEAVSPVCEEDMPERDSAVYIRHMAAGRVHSRSEAAANGK